MRGWLKASQKEEMCDITISCTGAPILINVCTLAKIFIKTMHKTACICPWRSFFCENARNSNNGTYSSCLACLGWNDANGISFYLCRRTIKETAYGSESLTVFTVLALHFANATQLETDPICVISPKSTKVRIVSAIVTVACIFTENFPNVNTC